MADPGGIHPQVVAECCGQEGKSSPRLNDFIIRQHPIAAYCPLYFTCSPVFPCIDSFGSGPICISSAGAAPAVCTGDLSLFIKKPLCFLCGFCLGVLFDDFAVALLG